MKKILAVTALVSLIALSVCAEGYVNANDLEKGTLTSESALEDGFKILSTAEKPVVIDAPGDPLPKNPDGEQFNLRINLKGKGNTEYRCVSFPAKAGETITVDCATSSKTDTRTLVVVDAEGNNVLSIAAAPGDVARGKAKAPKDGTYYAFSSGSGMYIYQIDVK